MAKNSRAQTYLAVLAVAGTLGGSFIGAAGSYYGVRSQVESQLQQDQTSYLRDQRRSAYARLVEQDQQLQTLATRISKERTPSPAPTRVRQINSDLKIYQVELDKLSQANTDVAIIGSPPMLRPAQDLLNAHLKLQSVVTFLAYDELASDGDLELVPKNLVRQLRAVEDKRAIFLMQSRRDLGLPN